MPTNLQWHLSSPFDLESFVNKPFNQRLESNQKKLGCYFLCLVTITNKMYGGKMYKNVRTNYSFRIDTTLNYFKQDQTPKQYNIMMTH